MHNEETYYYLSKKNIKITANLPLFNARLINQTIPHTGGTTNKANGNM